MKTAELLVGGLLATGVAFMATDARMDAHAQPPSVLDDRPYAVSHYVLPAELLGDWSVELPAESQIVDFFVDAQFGENIVTVFHPNTPIPLEERFFTGLEAHGIDVDGARVIAYRGELDDVHVIEVRE